MSTVDILEEWDQTPSLSDSICQEVGTLRDRVQAEAATCVVGMSEAVDQIFMTLLAGGHALLEGVPGVAKTTLSKAFAHILGLQFQRIQFTPDLMPSDITGTSILDRKINEFVLRKGPVFCQVLLADEINRAPAKTQAALLEAMQEGQVTLEGESMALPSPSWFWPPRIPWNRKGYIACLRPSSTAFWYGWKWGTPGEILKLTCFVCSAGRKPGPNPCSTQTPS